MSSLKRQAVSGVKWSSISQFGRQAMQFVTMIILARLLSPSDFGLVGMATVVIGFLDMFKDLGTSAALIQRKDISEKLTSSIFWFNVLFGCLVTIGMIIMSPLAVLFYREKMVASLLNVLSINFVISSLSIVQKSLLTRELQFKKLANVEIWATVSGSLIGIGCAYLGFGVWSLVYQTVAITLVTTVLLWHFSRWRPRATFHWAEVRSISAYSLNLTGFTVFNYFCRNADYLIIGRYLGAKELGYYTLAYRIMLYPLQSVTSVFGRILFPIFSQLQKDYARFRRIYLQVAATIALFTFPMMFGLWALAKPLVLVVFGPQWTPVIILLLILSPVGMIQSIDATTGPIFQATGRTDWLLRWGIGTGVLSTLCFFIGVHWGIIGVATAYAVFNIVLLYPGYAIPLKLIELPVSDLARVLWKPLQTSLLMFTMLMLLKMVLPSTIQSGLMLGLLVMAGFIIYLVASWQINRDQMMSVWKILRGERLGIAGSEAGR